MSQRRTVFYVSDRTGITAEMLGKSLLTQFRSIAFDKRVMPFIDNEEKAHAAAAEINRQAREQSQRPLVLSTLIDPAVRQIIFTANGFSLDLFEDFISRLEAELGVESSHAQGLTHGMVDQLVYDRRMAAVNFALSGDDGSDTACYAQADIILIGVSRSGKTPTCLYLAMQYMLLAANYPLTPDDFDHGLPADLLARRSKLFGLTLAPERLAKIRAERRPGSAYAEIETCRRELRAAHDVFMQQRIPFLDTTSMSVEEIAVTILHRSGLASRSSS